MPLGQDSGFPRAGPGGRVTPRFRHRLIRFRHFNSGSLALASLNLTRRESLSQRWLQRSPPSLLATAACSGLRPAPDCRPRRALLHLSYSSAPPYSDSAFVTHDPEQTLAQGTMNDRSAPMSAAQPKLVVSRKRTSGRSGPSTIMGGSPSFAGAGLVTRLCQKQSIFGGKFQSRTAVDREP
jgi:hypothetical protein